MRTITRGDPFLPPEIIALGRTPRGHPEGLCEAFANIYAEVAQERMARALGETVPELPYPRIEEGAHTMAFIEACVASQAKGTWVSLRSEPGSSLGYCMNQPWLTTSDWPVSALVGKPRRRARLRRRRRRS